MDELLQFYKRSLAGFTLAVVFAVLFIHDAHIPNIKILQILTSRSAIVLVVAIGEITIRKWLWKIAYPELNFKGKWIGTTTYTHAELGPTEFKEFSVAHELLVRQDCLSFSIEPTTAAGSYVTWNSLAANILDRNTVCYAYAVDYRKKKDDERFPEEAKGYEQLKVTSRDDSRRGLPMELTGQFFHCAMGQRPLYRGTVNFTREES